MDELKISYERGWDNICVNIDIPVPYKENYQIRMLKNNRFSHLAYISGSGRNGISRYSFRSESGVLMEEKFRTTDIHAEQIVAFTEQFLKTAEFLSEHMLDPGGILLDPKIIFADKDDFQFCYLPIESSMNACNIGESFHKMTEYFVSRMDYSDTQGVLLVCRLHKETMEKNYDLKKIISDHRTEYMDNKGMKEYRGLSEGTVFLADEENEEERMNSQNSSMIKEKSAPYGPVRKIINKIKTGRWGEWEDLITEIDGQDR